MDSMDHKDKKQETINFEEEYDMCVSCGKVTSYKKTAHIDYRYGYIEGAGQLCFTCNQTKKMHKTGTYA